eukprot:scaffold49191_cov23-Cyclotella_meneghiniana.AAC.3
MRVRVYLAFGLASQSTLLTNAFVQNRCMVQPLTSFSSTSIIKSPFQTPSSYNNNAVNFSSTAQKASAVPYPVDGCEL